MDAMKVIVLVCSATSFVCQGSEGVPKLVEFNFPKDLTMGEETVFSCHVRRGAGPYRFAWFKDGMTLVPSDRMSVFQVSARMVTLTFRNVGPMDVGNYSCEVTNHIGKDTVSANLRVTGR